MLADTFTDWVAMSSPGAVGAAVLGVAGWLWWRFTRPRRYGHLVPLRWRLLGGLLALALALVAGLGQRITTEGVRVLDDRPVPEAQP